MTSIQTQFGLGLEELATETFLLLLEELNSYITDIEAEKVDIDREVALRRGVQYRPFELEQVNRQNFHLGHVPSLIYEDTPLEHYPAVSVMSYRSTPAPTSSLYDQAAIHRDQLYVEVLVKAGPDDRDGWAEELCDRRAWRSAEAVLRAMQQNRTLNGMVEQIGDPTVLISEVFTRPGSDLNPNDDWFWQAARIEYGVDKYSPFN